MHLQSEEMGEGKRGHNCGDQWEVEVNLENSRACRQCLWDRKMEQLLNGVQAKLMQMGVLERALSVSQKILLLILTVARTSSQTKKLTYF
jgi:hypothetical protein